MSLDASKFSSTNNHNLRAFPYQYRPINKISPWEQEVLDLINQTGAAAYSQLIPTDISISRQNKLTKKLDSLNKVGLLRKYQLSEINICASKSYDNPIDLLKSLVFTQFIQKAKLIDPSLEIYSPTLVKFCNNVFSVIIIRQSDDPIFLYSIQEKTIILSEKFLSEFTRIKAPVRIILDKDLFCENPHIPFYLSDGSTELIKRVG